MEVEREREHLKWLEKLAKEARLSLDRKIVERDKLIDEVTKLARDAMALEQAMNTIRESMGLRSPELKRTRFSDMTIREAAEIAMRESGGQMKTVDVVKALREGGKDLGDRAYSVVVATIGRSNHFEKVDRGVFRLVTK